MSNHINLNNVVEGFLGYLPDLVGGVYGERERERELVGLLGGYSLMVFNVGLFWRFSVFVLC